MSMYSGMGHEPRVPRLANAATRAHEREDARRALVADAASSR